jgi:hypothetical protein
MAAVITPGHQLILACKAGDREKVEAFLKEGVDPNERHAGAYERPLGAAIRALQPDIIRLLISHGANPNAFVGEGWEARSGFHYPLDVAQWNLELGDNYLKGNEIYRVLVENGAIKHNKEIGDALQSMINVKRMKDRAKTYLCVSKVLPLDLAQMVAECF